MVMTLFGKVAVFLILAGCAGVHLPPMPADFLRRDVVAGKYTLLTMQRDTDAMAPVRVYIEGDGHAFNSRGIPTSNPTPKDSPVWRWAAADDGPNVVYVARPCQYIMSDACSVRDWTTGRFSPDIIEAVTAAVRDVARVRPVVLIGYSGGALVTGLVIENASDVNVQRWITVAGVLNHSDWTTYFGDSPLRHSVDLDVLPDVPQTHYVAENDDVVPVALSRKWVEDVIIVPNVGHGF